MNQQGPPERRCVTHVTSRRSSLLQGVGLGLMLAVLAWASLEGDWRWPLAAVALVVGLAAAPLWSPVETLWLEDTRLVEQKSGRVTAVDLARLTSVRRDWVPYKGDTLTLTDENGNRINIWLLGEQTEALRRAIGEAARFSRASTNLHDPKTRRLLVLDPA